MKELRHSLKLGLRTCSLFSIVDGDYKTTDRKIGHNFRSTFHLFKDRIISLSVSDIYEQFLSYIMTRTIYISITGR
jgi:hypothetical protein